MPHQCAHWFAMTDLVGVCAPGGGSSVLRFCQGTRIAAPVCALVRNDMQKAVALLRVQGRGARKVRRGRGRGCGCKDAFRQCPGIMRTRGKLLHVIARSGATWQSASPAAAQAKRNYSRRIRSHCEFAQSSTCLIDIPAGTRIAAPVCALVRNDRLGRCVRTRGRQQCTTFLPGDADCHASSPQSPPCPAPTKDQSRATLPWGSSPHKGCPFAGPHALVRNDMQKAVALLRVQGREARGVRRRKDVCARARTSPHCHCEERSCKR